MAIITYTNEILANLVLKTFVIQSSTQIEMQILNILRSMRHKKCVHKLIGGLVRCEKLLLTVVFRSM